jgi:pyrroloquinoline quinone biosynthesis protein B
LRRPRRPRISREFVARKILLHSSDDFGKYAQPGAAAQAGRGTLPTMRRSIALAPLALVALSCATAPGPPPNTPYAVVLGIAQDGGYPQAGCNRPDCIAAWRNPALRRHVASLAIVDPRSGRRWLIDATPDFPSQLRTLDELAPRAASAPLLDGILLTHAHIGHYLGLAQLGREVLGTKSIRVYAMPRMRTFLEHNGPWDQLVRLGNISIEPLEDGREIALGEQITVTPLLVPHRDEYSETVGFLIRGPSRSILWLPDIDKWEKWPLGLERVLAKVDVAYLDGTFFDATELPGRDLREIPHPLMTETMARLAGSSLAAKVRFIHLNQSNPLLRSPRTGYLVAVEGVCLGL